MPLFWLSIAFILGVWFASLITLSTGWWVGLAGLGLSFILLPCLLRLDINRTPRVIRFFLNLIPTPIHQKVVGLFTSQALPLSLFYLIPLAVCSFFSGAARYQAVQPEISMGHIAWYNDNQLRMEVVGVVNAPPDERDYYTQLRVETELVRYGDDGSYIEVEGLLLARVPVEGDWHYGDRIILSGEIQTPAEDEGFSYRDYLARQGIYGYMPYAYASLLESGQGNFFLSWVYAFKQHALDLVYRFFPDPEASLMAGILLGVETGIDEDVQQAFRDTGTSHVIAISGFNLTIVAGFFTITFGRWLGRKRGAVAAGMAIAVYTILVGADAAVLRAAIMAGMSLIARQVGRRQTGLNGLAITAGIMAFFTPMILWDVGFQLSFAATLGLVLYADPFSRAFETLASKHLPEPLVQRLVGPVGEYFLFTLAAQLTTLPIIVYHFNRFSLSSFPANIAILPAQPPIMMVGSLAVLLGLIWFPLGQGAAYIVWPFVAYTIRMVEWFARFSGGVIVFGAMSWVWVLIFYALLFALTVWGREIRVRFPKVRPAVVFSGLVVGVSLVWQMALFAPDGKLHITVLDVGTGSAILIQTPQGRYVLVDGGPSARRLSDGVGRRLPLFHRELDIIVVASPLEEHVAGLPRIVERFRVGGVLWSGTPNLSYEARYLEETLVDAGVPVVVAQVGHVVDLGAGASLEALTVGERGAIYLLAWGNFRMLLPLGADFDALESLDMGNEIGPVTALLLADSGYAPVNPPEWINNLQPQIVLLSVAAGDYNGLPSPETLEAVEGYTLLRTDLNGWIHISTDGEQMWVEVEKGNK